VVSGSRERDDAVERLLRQSRPQSGRVTDACLDAETVAAWLDGGLSGPALDMAQSHVADCARCQAMVGSIARIESRVPQVSPERTARPWLAWLLPLTAAAAAIAIWVAVPRYSRSPLPATANVEPIAPSVSRDARTSRERDQTKPSFAADEQKQLDSLTARKSDAKDHLQPTLDAPELRNDAARLKPEASKPIAPPSAGKLRVREEASNAAVAGATAASSAAPAPPAAAPSAAAAPAPPTTALADKAAEPNRANERAAQRALNELAAPSSPARWRIAGSGLQRSTNGGQLWEDVSTGVTTPLTAVAAPSASVCWVAGRGGVVLLSTDGNTWRRVPFPETTDLAAIRATDSRSASVTTADGRTFDTSDGGVTWVLRQPVQEF
jgi:hypothetical protein